jgi:peroxiredoxin
MACNAESPHLQKLSEKVRGRGGIVVGIAMANDGLEGVVKFRRRNRVDYPIAFDREDRFDKETTEVPSAVLVDRKGVVRWLEEGFDPESFAALEKKFFELLGKP